MKICVYCGNEVEEFCQYCQEYDGVEEDEDE
jgi:hypothetical protein